MFQNILSFMPAIKVGELRYFQQNTSVTMTAATDPTSATTEAYEYGVLDNTFPSSKSETDTPSTATLKTSAGHIPITTLLCLQLTCLRLLTAGG
mmetsp:Transcript_26123/g.38356  ORF Transcript_26123/g.38356 Transcript_26123/m.38356 type:complete len:94 (-) Transcript_26123:162-443(-)